MEAGLRIALSSPGPHVLVESNQPEPDHELIAFVGEVVADLPPGEGLTAGELRVDYLLEKLSAEAKRIEGVREFTARRVEMVTAHGQAEIEKLRRRVAWLESKIREHMPLDPASFKKHYGAKSTRLPHGQIGYRASRASVEIVDQEKALAFAKARGLEVRVTESVNKTPLLESVVRDGEEPDPVTDGFRYVPPTDAFFITPDLEFI